MLIAVISGSLLYAALQELKQLKAREDVEAARHVERGEQKEGRPFMGDDHRDYTDMVLKEDHQNRPLWICPDRHIFLETESVHYAKALDFVVAIAEPVNRATFIHEYKVSSYSLFAAVTVGLESSSIIKTLHKFSKVVVPECAVNFITSCTQQYGKLRIVLENDKYFLEAEELPVLTGLQPKIQDCLSDPDGILLSNPKASLIASFTREVANISFQRDDAKEEADTEHLSVHRLQLLNHMVTACKTKCADLEYPTLDEWDFHHDTSTRKLDITLRPTTSVRNYQAKALSKMFTGTDPTYNFTFVELNIWQVVVLGQGLLFYLAVPGRLWWASQQHVPSKSLHWWSHRLMCRLNSGELSLSSTQPLMII